MRSLIEKSQSLTRLCTKVLTPLEFENHNGQRDKPISLVNRSLTARVYCSEVVDKSPTSITVNHCVDAAHPRHANIERPSNRVPNKGDLEPYFTDL